jgi:hypothetical protein
VSDVKLINKEQRWESGGLRVYLGNTNYVSVTATCIRVKKVKAVMHPLNGLTLNEHKVPMAIPVTATITGGVNATASYPTADHTASTTFVAAVKCVVDGVTKQFSNLAITFSGSTISCTLPETATSCTFVIQNY